MSSDETIHANSMLLKLRCMNNNPWRFTQDGARSAITEAQKITKTAPHEDELVRQLQKEITTARMYLNACSFTSQGFGQSPTAIILGSTAPPISFGQVYRRLASEIAAGLAPSTATPKKN